jgi:rhodanese-related sulfurtransferase
MIAQITPRELHTRIERGENPYVLDVREGWELAICQLPGATHISMRQIPARLAELPRDREIVVMCHHGVRSQHVAMYLEQQGFDRLLNLAGGIAAWSRDVDPHTPTY